jgi:hypothetical protein
LWCQDWTYTLVNCEGTSIGCYYKILCHHPCVCDSWKDVPCGGKTSGNMSQCTQEMKKALLQGNLQSAVEPVTVSSHSMIQRSSSHTNTMRDGRNVLGFRKESQIDDAVLGKCTA